MNNKKRLILISTLCLLAACATAPPQKPEDLCEIFFENRDWYDAAKDAQAKWGTPIHIPMAMMYQESSFRADARPPMEYFLGFIPIGRASSAYGYSQAKTPTWEDYKRETGNGWADRDDFEDAIDFMAWFIYKTHKVNGVSKWDAYNQYLNYHEGWGGYRKKSYNRKAWLKKVAAKVQGRAERYGAQLKRCEEELSHGWLWRLFFG
ncbi:transglycosylase SLT domain-containing protein [Catenovulum sediminis]|uniref:Transglycosylase SLT domain-containing protein n=1 Tax=Catenovulum sediminis TaxID=1740262 RepID=A0ABV1REP7_9ALTE|nr:transglycosylase SLT domain-containing protein [Catenovulum sediminis]